MVVIGILIALQINEWQLDKEIEERTLRNIKKDLGEDIKNLNDVLVFKTRQQVYCSELIGLFVNTTSPVEDTVEMQNKIMLLSYFILPAANNTAFEAYKNESRMILPLGEFRRDSEIENYLNNYSIRLKIGINYLRIKAEHANRLIELIDHELMI